MLCGSLDGFTYSGEGYVYEDSGYEFSAAIYTSDVDLKIEPKGNNEITCTGDLGIAAIDRNLTISGSGTGDKLTVVGSMAGINCDNTLKIINANVVSASNNFSYGGYGLLAKHIEISDSTVIATGGNINENECLSAGIVTVNGSLVVHNGTVTALSGTIADDCVDSDAYGVYLLEGTAKINGGTVIAQGATGAFSNQPNITMNKYGVYAGNDADVAKYTAKPTAKVYTESKYVKINSETPVYSGDVYVPVEQPKDEPKEPSKMDAVTDCHGDASCPISGYTDIDNDAWYHDGVHYCIENGIMGGYGNGIFRPNVAVSRAQISAMLWNMEGNPVVNYALDYKDVPADAWYTEAVRWMVSQNIAGGYGKGIYAPDDTLTREQLAAILQKYAQYKGYDMAANKEVDLQSYSDAASISNWAYTSMQWICDSGIVGGMPGTNGDIILAPAGHATRAQVATMLMTFCEMEKE